MTWLILLHSCTLCLQFLLLHFPVFLDSIPDVTHLSSSLTPLAVAALAVLGPTGPCKVMRPTCQTIARLCSKELFPWLNQWPTQSQLTKATSVQGVKHGQQQFWHGIGYPWLGHRDIGKDSWQPDLGSIKLFISGWTIPPPVQESQPDNLWHCCCGHAASRDSTVKT